MADLQRNVTQTEFEMSRKNSRQNEINTVSQWVGKNISLSADTLDNGFSDKAVHSPKNAQDHLPGQKLAIAVVATPVKHYK